MRCWQKLLTLWPPLALIEIGRGELLGWIGIRITKVVVLKILGEKHRKIWSLVWYGCMWNRKILGDISMGVLVGANDTPCGERVNAVWHRSWLDPWAYMHRLDRVGGVKPIFSLRVSILASFFLSKVPVVSICYYF